MATIKRLNSVQRTWDEYGGWVILVVLAYILFSFRKVFSSLGDAAGAKAEASVAEVAVKAKTTAAKASVKAATGNKREPTDAEISKWQADAASIVAMFGSNELFSLNRRPQDAFSLIKRGYSRLNLHNNKPFMLAKDGKTMIPQTIATAASATNKINWKVLVPFYKELTDGRDLLADMRLNFTDSGQKALLKWII